MKKYFIIILLLFSVNLLIAQSIPSSLNYTSAEQISIDFNYPYINEGPVNTIDKTLKYRISITAKNSSTQSGFIFYFGSKAEEPIITSGNQANHYKIVIKLLESEFQHYLDLLDSKNIFITYQDLPLYPPTVRVGKTIN